MRESKSLTRLKQLRDRIARLRHKRHFRMKQVAIKTECGAAMCFIGHTLVAAGYKIRLRKQGSVYKGDDAARSDYDFISPAGRRLSDPYRKAQTLLGLHRTEAEQLFEDYDIRTVRQAVKRLDGLIVSRGRH